MDNSSLIYIILICAVLILFRFFQGYMRKRREEKDFERTQDIVYERTKMNTSTTPVDARTKGSNRRLGFRRKGDRRKEKEDRRTTNRRNGDGSADWEGDDLRKSERRSALRRLLDRRKSDRRIRERRKN